MTDAIAYVVTLGHFYGTEVIGVFRDRTEAGEFALEQPTEKGSWMVESESRDLDSWTDDRDGRLAVKRWEIT